MAEPTAEEIATELFVNTKRIHGSVCWPGTDAIEAVIAQVVDRCAGIVEDTPTVRGRVIWKPREIATAIRQAFYPPPAAAEHSNE